MRRVLPLVFTVCGVLAGIGLGAAGFRHYGPPPLPAGIALGEPAMVSWWCEERGPLEQIARLDAAGDRAGALRAWVAAAQDPDVPCWQMPSAVPVARGVAAWSAQTPRGVVEVAPIAVAGGRRGWAVFLVGGAPL